MRINRVGLEREVFAFKGDIPFCTKGFVHPLNGQAVSHGFITSDAGVGLAEAVTLPKPSLGEAIESLAFLERGLGCEVYRVSHRPVGEQHRWVDEPRYDTVIAALYRERGGRYGGVFDMADRASVHLNISGDFDPVGPEGVLICNFINNAGPYFAAYVHEQLGYGKEHLAIWQGFADPRRLPSWQHWFSSSSEYQTLFTKIPRLLAKEGSEWRVGRGGERQEWGNAVDHGVFWHLARPKPVKDGDWYLELRILPSMEDEKLQIFGEALLRGVERVLDWYEEIGRPQSVTREEAETLFRYVGHSTDGFPSTMRNEAEWLADLSR